MSTNTIVEPKPAIKHIGYTVELSTNEDICNSCQAKNRAIAFLVDAHSELASLVNSSGKNALPDIKRIAGQIDKLVHEIDRTRSQC